MLGPHDQPGRTKPSEPQRRDQPPRPSTRRLAASRRRALGIKARRLVPPLIVGTTTLAGTGVLVAWVSNQPGVKPTSTLTISSASASTRPATSTTNAEAAREAQVLTALQQQLKSEETALQTLQATVTQAAATRRAAAASIASPSAASAGGSPVASSTPGGASTAPLPALTPLPTIPTVVVPPPAPVVAAPVVSATTGASHAVP